MKKTKVISVSSSKGGVGKSTLTSILATGLLSHFKKNVVILDVDPQQSIIEVRKSEQDFIKNNPPKPNSLYYQTLTKNLEETNQYFPDVFSLSLYDDFSVIKEKIDKLKGKYDYIFLDFPGSLNIHENTLLLLKELDFILIPYYVDQNNSNSTFKFINAINNLKEKNSLKADYTLFFNRFNGLNGKNGGLFAEAKKYLIEAKIPILENVFYEFTEIERFSTILPVKPSNSKKNVYSITQEINTLLSQ